MYVVARYARLEASGYRILCNKAAGSYYARDPSHGFVKGVSQNIATFGGHEGFDVS